MDWYKPASKLSDHHDTPFGCCAANTVCLMGKMECVWEKFDLNYAKLCSVYKRKMRREIGVSTCLTRKVEPVKGKRKQEKPKYIDFESLDFDLFFNIEKGR